MRCTEIIITMGKKTHPGNIKHLFVDISVIESCVKYCQ